LSEQPFSSTLNAQVDALLQRVTRERDHRCNLVRSTTDSQAREIIRAARTEARSRVHDAVAQQRVRIAEAVRQAEARLELEARERAQEETRSLLTHMWAEISGVLSARWRDPAHRREWLQAAVMQALRLLDTSFWRIDYPTQLAAAERSDVESLAPKRTGRRIEWIADGAIQAGIRVHSEGVCLDATIAGLLADRAAVEAGFLAVYLTHPDTQRGRR
jgi:vacuolar-type H+-ATPase subunit H